MISWNVNGLRACLDKGFADFFSTAAADVFCLQETKMQPGQMKVDFPGYDLYWHSAVKKGYAGTAVFSRVKPLAVRRGMAGTEDDPEGRLLTLEFADFFLVNVYTPNSQRGLLRLEYRVRWEEEFRRYLEGLDKVKPVIICGDLNVAHQEIDIKNPQANRRNAGFTDEERGKMTALLAAGFMDVFRYFYPHKQEAYTWWSYMRDARARNIGWRIDYFLASARLAGRLATTAILNDVPGSDHCPIALEIT